MFSRLIVCAVVAFLVLGADSQAQPTGETTDEPIIHDPVMAQHDGMYYLYGTGYGLDVWSSPDLQTWTREPAVFSETPAWVFEMLPEFEDHVWAPDIYAHDGTYYLYYSVSAFGRNNSAIGVATNTTLDPDEPAYEWVDHGPVVQSVPGRDMWNAIDANVIHDGAGAPWITFGSHWGGLKLARLERDDLKRLASTHSEQEWHTVAARHRYWKLDERDAGDAANPELNYDSLYAPNVFTLNRESGSGAVEAPFLFAKDGTYYLFASWDRCCRGVNSTYKVVVGRSRTITGPYLDREGQNMAHGGGTLVTRGFGESERWAAGGHNAAYTFAGTDYLVFHAYDTTDEGAPKLILQEIQWDAQGWPHVTMED